MFNHIQNISSKIMLYSNIAAKINLISEEIRYTIFPLSLSKNYSIFVIFLT